MHDVPIPPELARDPQGEGLPGVGMERDPVRTPMQWSAAPQAGFTSGRPWLPLAPDYQACNVASQRNDPCSLLCWYRDLIALRRVEPAFVRGSYAPFAAEGDVLAYVRAADQRRFLIALNLGNSPTRLPVSPAESRGRIVLGTHPQRQGSTVTDTLELAANEGVIVLLSC